MNVKISSELLCSSDDILTFIYNSLILYNKYSVIITYDEMFFELIYRTSLYTMFFV
jgi:hypothetical protein